jgi:hypothetical protein
LDVVKLDTVRPLSGVAGEGGELVEQVAEAADGLAAGVGFAEALAWAAGERRAGAKGSARVGGARR